MIPNCTCEWVHFSSYVYRKIIFLLLPNGILQFRVNHCVPDSSGHTWKPERLWLIFMIVKIDILQVSNVWNFFKIVQIIVSMILFGGNVKKSGNFFSIYEGRTWEEFFTIILWRVHDMNIVYDRKIYRWYVYEST